MPQFLLVLLLVTGPGDGESLLWMSMDLYGDVFGILQLDEPNYDEESVDRCKHWGDLEEEDEEEEE